MNLKPMIKTMRINQWAKNAFIFAPILFDARLFHVPSFLRTSAGFILFCLLNSGIYVFNDLCDKNADQAHPTKRNRPIASGTLQRKTAIRLGIALISIAIFGSYLLDFRFFVLSSVIIAINALYTLYIKRQPILDVITIGILFLLRMQGGILLVQVKVFSPWLYLVTFMLALYLGFGKRRAELAELSSISEETRPALSGYSLPLLDQIITIVSSITIMAYSLYTFSGPTLPADHKMMLTIPFVVYGIFRYHYLIEIQQAGGAPEEALMKDIPLQITILLYGLSVIYLLYG